jgi:hypothetical protein
MIMTLMLEDEQFISASTYSPTLITQSQHHSFLSPLAVPSLPMFCDTFEDYILPLARSAHLKDYLSSMDD